MRRHRANNLPVLSSSWKIVSNCTIHVYIRQQMHINNAVGCGGSFHIISKATLHPIHLKGYIVSLSVSLLSPCPCSHSLSFVPYSPSSLSCSNWMCSRRISLQLLAAVESSWAHAAFSTNRCRSISYSAILTWLENAYLFLEGVQ